MKVTDSPIITSKDNPRLKLARAVRDGREKGMIFIEGVRLASEILKSRVDAMNIFVADGATGKTEELALELTESTGAEISYVARRVFDTITDTDNSQGIVLLADRPENRSIGELDFEKGIVLYLNEINNPSNLGAVIRTAEAAGSAGIMISRGSADPFSPKSLRSSMGSGFRLPICTDVDFAGAINLALEKGVRTFAADIKATKSYTAADWSGKNLLVLGSEAHGLEARQLELVSETVLIPMENGVESLNLAVSAGILLFEAKRQRDLGNFSESVSSN